MAVKCYRDLIAWQKAMEFVTMTYRLTTTFPREEIYGLTAQLRRAAVSIPSNIAEGQGRQSTRDFLHFLVVARGSLNEAQTQILIAQRLQYLTDERSSELLELGMEVGRLLNGLCNALNSKVDSH